MGEIERLERVAKQMAVLAVELNAMGYQAIGAYLTAEAMQLMKRSMELLEEQRQALLDKAELVAFEEE